MGEEGDLPGVIELDVNTFSPLHFGEMKFRGNCEVGNVVNFDDSVLQTQPEEHVARRGVAVERSGYHGTISRDNLHHLGGFSKLP